MKLFHLMLATSLLVACESGTTSTADNNSTESNATTAESVQDKNKKTLAAAYDAMEHLDAAKMMEHIAPDAVDYGDGSMTPIKGADSIKAAVSQWLSAMENYKIDNLKMLAEGDEVWAFGTFAGKFKDDIMGIATKGKSIKTDDVELFTFNDQGQITSHRSIQSMYTFFGELGLPLPPKK